MKIRPLFAAALVAAAVLGAAACAPPPAATSSELSVDQDFGESLATHFGFVQHCSDGDGFQRQLAQTFNAGHSGSLQQVSLRLAKSETPLELQVSIQELDVDGKPTGVSIGSGAYDGIADPEVLTEIPLSEHARVNAGTGYAIVLSTPANGACGTQGLWTPYMVQSATDPFTFGRALFKSDFSAGWQVATTFPAGEQTDLVFRTWVAS